MDLTGQRFGKLTVLRLEVPKPYSKKSYLCRCDCGNICTRLETTLTKGARDGRISSCGCYSKGNLIPGSAELCSKAGKHRKDAFVNGSNVQMIFREGTISTNTSGQQGVSWSGTAHKWHCYINYRNYRANLGFYEDINDAIKVRKLAEKAIKENNFEEFFYEVRGRRLGEKEKQHFKNKQGGKG